MLHPSLRFTALLPVALGLIAVAVVAAQVPRGTPGLGDGTGEPGEVARAYAMPDGSVVVVHALQVPDGEEVDPAVLDDLVPDGEPLSGDVTAQFSRIWKWRPEDIPVVMTYNPAGEPDSIDGADVVQVALATWSATEGQTFSFGYGGLSNTPPYEDCGLPSADAENNVSWRDLDGNILAVTCHRVTPTGQVPEPIQDCVRFEDFCGTVEADILIDPDWQWSDDDEIGSQDFDLRSNVLHEVGHVLGLGHTQNSNAVMYGSLMKGTKKRNLRQDDINGQVALYPVPLELRAAVAELASNP